jgi:hypothetical protein
VTEFIGGAGALLAAAGVVIIACSDGARALSLGVAGTGLGLAMALAVAGGGWAALALAISGIVVAGLRVGDEPRGWQVLPHGSTPRVMASVAAVAMAAYGSLAVLGPAGGRALHGAVLVAAAVSSARLLAVQQRSGALAGLTALLLAAGAAAAQAAQFSALPATIAGAVAIAVNLRIFRLIEGAAR